MQTMKDQPLIWLCAAIVVVVAIFALANGDIVSAVLVLWTGIVFVAVAVRANAYLPRRRERASQHGR